MGEIFSDAGLVVTGSVARMLSGEEMGLRTSRLGYCPEEKVYSIVPSCRDVDGIAVANIAPGDMAPYLHDKGRLLAEMSPGYRELLDLTVADSSLAGILKQLKETSQEYEEAQGRSSRNSLKKITARRLSLDRSMRGGSHVYAPIGGSFLEGGALPSDLARCHSMSAAAGLPCISLGNRDAASEFIAAASGAYVPEEIGGRAAECAFIRRLKDSGTRTIPGYMINSMALLAERNGYERTEASLMRNVRGMWRPNVDRKPLESLARNLKEARIDLYRMVYGQA